jgi:hypothetical protein
MYFIKLAGFFPAEVGHFHGYDPEASGIDHF